MKDVKINTKRAKYYSKRTALYAAIVIIIVYMLFPFYWALNCSFKTEMQLQMTPATFLPLNPDTMSFAPTLKNYFAIFQDSQFLMGILNSTIVSFFSVVLALSIGAFAAFALGKLRFKGKAPAMYIVLAMTMFPQVTVLAGLYAVINHLGLTPRISMILSYLLFTLPFTVWVLTAFFRDLPSEIMKSAQVDGATPFQSFHLIMLPLTAPALVTTGLLAFIAAWNEYLFALTFTAISPSSRTIPVAIAMFTGSVSYQEPTGEIMAAACAVTVPIIVLVLYFQKRIVAGLTAGAVKG